MQGRILVIDGQGGRIGSSVIAALKASGIRCTITAVGTNSTATESMMKAGADAGATGVNAICVNSRHCDIIIGPIGIVIADSLLGEITAEAATAVGRSDAVKLMIPVNQCNNQIIGVQDLSLKALILHTIEKVRELLPDGPDIRRI